MARGPGEDLRNPDFSGSIGRAWEVELTPEGLSRPEQSSALGMWLIEAPFVVPAWSYHGAALIHLRDIPGGDPPMINRDGATHEFHMLPLDPKFEDFYDPSDITCLQHPITSPDISEQLIVPSDEIALEIAKTAIQKCVEGELLPDSDYRSQWHSFFRSAEGEV